MLDRICRRYVHVAVASLAAVTFAVAPSPSARIAAANSSAVGCVGRACTGLDPELMGCDRNARTVARARDHENIVLVELRYSKMCKAYWSRTTLRKGIYEHVPFAQMGDGEVTQRVDDRRIVWSYMWPSKIKACGGIYLEGPAILACTR
jgi:hypothetical protein